MKKKLMSLTLAMAMSLSLCVPVFAASTDIVRVVPENKQEVIGKGSDAVIDTNSVSLDSRSSSLLFSITTDGGTGFQELLVSGSSKTFKESDLTNGALKITGKLSSTSSVDKYLRAGYCIYNASKDEYSAADYARFKNGVESEAYFESNFYYAYTYYGFASKDTAGTSYAKGTLKFYNATPE